jgi:hypothetical protein
MADYPAQEFIDEAIEKTGFKKSVVEFLWDEFLEDSNSKDFFEYLGEMLGDASFIIAASKGLSIQGCLEAYDIGYTLATEGYSDDDLEDLIDSIEIKGLPSTEDDSEES